MIKFSLSTSTFSAFACLSLIVQAHAASLVPLDFAKSAANPGNVPRMRSILQQRDQAYSKSFKAPAELNNFQFKTGQVIAISEFSDPTTLVLELATGSRFGHIGVVIVLKNGVYVAEANAPFAYLATIGGFLGRAQGKNGLNAVILEPKQALNADQVLRISAEAEKFVKAPVVYNFGFEVNSGASNCSEMVARVMVAGGVDVGVLETYAQQNVRSALVQMALSAFGKRPSDIKMDAHVLTPVSIVASPNLKVVYGTLPVRFVSEQEILQGWQAAGYLEPVLQVMGVAAVQIPAVIAQAQSRPYR